MLRVFTLVLATIVACAPSRPGSLPRAPRTVLEVDNRNYSDMAIYLVNSGQRVRLGTVTGNTKADLTIPNSLLGGSRRFQFLADPIGGDRRSISSEIYVQPGDRVQLILP
jgi:hypothetical protein